MLSWIVGEGNIRSSDSVSMAALFGPHEPSCHSPNTEYSFWPLVAFSSVQSFNTLSTRNEHFSDPAAFFTLHCLILPRELPGMTSILTDEVDNAVRVRSLIGLPKSERWCHYFLALKRHLIKNSSCYLQEGELRQSGVLRGDIWLDERSSSEPAKAYI